MSLIHFNVITAKSLGTTRAGVQEQKYAKIAERMDLTTRKPLSSGWNVWTTKENTWLTQDSAMCGRKKKIFKN